MKSKKYYEDLLPYARTEVQKERVQACIDNVSQTEAAKKLGIDCRRVHETIKQIAHRARRMGHVNADESFKPIDTHYIKGESALVDSEGKTKLRWIKTDTDKEARLQAIQETMTNVFKEFKGLSPIVPAPKYTEEDLLCLIPIGDAHISLLAWGEETGEDYDMSIAERDMQIAFDRLIEQAPKAKTCMIVDLGDFLHRNNDANRTKSGHELDCDSRWVKSFRVATKILIYAVYRALEKFEVVHLRNTYGNHSTEGEQALNVALDLYFHNNDRVIVETSPNPFFYFQWGKVLMGFTHGDRVKHNELPMIMAADVPKMWGETIHRYIYLGHLHHSIAKEYQGCKTEVFNTLSQNDYWHHKSGYRAGKNMKLLVLHKEHGEVERFTMDISAVRKES